MTEPLVSIIVPTFNRADFLPRALHSLLCQTVEPASYEVVVVDNNSTDATGEIVKLTAREHAAIRYVLELRQGVSHAKNAGLEAARGSIVAYIDDDAIAAPDWLRIIIHSFEHVRPAPHVVGGPAIPLFVGQRPLWYRDSYEIKSWGETPRFLNRSECFYGLNVAFRREALAGVGGFDTRLGMKGTSLAFEEDCEVFERLWEFTGGCLSAYYAPGALVRHFIPDSRVKPVYRLKRGFANGQSQHDRESARSGRGGLDCWLRSAYRFSRIVLWAAIRWRRLPCYKNWMIESGVPVAERLGHLAAASGLRANLRRSH